MEKEQYPSEGELLEKESVPRINKKHWRFPKAIKIFSIFLVIVLLVFAGYFFIQKKINAPTNGEFSQVWRLLPEKVSKSAAIKVYLPAGMTREQVSKSTVFDPEIKGQWVGEKQGFFNLIGVVYGQSEKSGYDYALFKPEQPLAVDLHYAAIVDIGEGRKMSADFLSVDDPKIEVILPQNDMEAPEDSKITIVFNRPMVALSTADLMEPKGLPVDILPKTDGKWKWISTNTLQFIPSSQLKLSTEYTVKIKSGLISMDGLEVGAAEAKFTTRKLRYLDENNQVNEPIIYNQPLRIYFNQPVDLDKTVAQMKLSDMGASGSVKAGTGKDIKFIAQYKKNDQANVKKQAVSRTDFMSDPLGAAKTIIGNFRASIFDILPKNSSDSGNDTDKSVIEIYAAKDKFGRTKFWDTQNVYRLVIDKAYPESGGISFDSVKAFDFTTTGLVKSTSEVDGRSPYADTRMFDPEGRLKIAFYEEVNLGSSKISASVPVVKTEYGQKCRDENFNLNDFNCQKVEDKSVLLVTFGRQGITSGQTISVSLDSIVGIDGQKINAQAVKFDVSVYKPLQYRIGESSLSQITLCSNNPIEVPKKEDFKTKLSANLDYEIFYWNESRIYNNDRSPCAHDEFLTNIGVGMAPESEYHLIFSINDVFGQAAQNSFDIKTGAMESKSVDIFQMQQNYSVTTPDKTKLVFGTKNITYANVEFCKLEAIDFYREKERLENYSERKKNPKPSGCVQSQKIQVTLPERYWVSNYFNIDLAQQFGQSLGNYIITISHPLFTDYKKNPAYLTSFVTVTNLAVAQKTVDPSTYIGKDDLPLTVEQLASFENLYWVSDIKSMGPVGGAKITVYNDKGDKVLGQFKTDNQGIAKMAPMAGTGPAVIESGNDIAIVYKGDSRLNWADSAVNAKKAYIYTDRPIYRPGDTVNVKGILRLGYDGNYQSWPGSEVELEARDPRWNVSWSQAVKLNDYGTAQAQIKLDGTAPLGSYQICVKDTYQCGNFDVKEYSPAAFQVTAKTDKEEYVSKENIKINLDAAYYFGVPLENAKVEYTISSQNYYFDKYPGGYDFGFYEDCGQYYCYGDKFISRGTLDLDSEGKGVINEAIDLQKISDQDGNANSKILVFDITAKNSMGQSISTQKSLIVHAGDIYIGAKTEPYFAAKNQEIKLIAKTVAPDGKVRNNAGKIAATVYKVDWVYAKRLEAGGNYNYDWEKRRVEVKTVNIDGSGDYSGKLALDKVGEYEIDFKIEDKNKNKVMTRSNVYIYGDGVASIKPYNDTTLELKAARTDLEAGQEGQLIIESPFTRAKALIAIERGKIFEYKIVDINGSLYNYTFKAVEDYAPNVFVSVLLQSGDPAVKYGSQEFKINGRRDKLDVKVTPDKKNYQPGDNVVLNISAKDGQGNPVVAELSVAVADVSVLALAGNPKKEPVIFFYNGFPLAVNTSSNIKNILIRQDLPNSKGGSGGGGEGDEKVRGEFRDTALWRGEVVTDSMGNASVEFNLPDNLTTWQVEVLGVTKDTKLGSGYAEFISRKDLMVVPLKPRFILPGDDFYIGAQVFNQSTENKKIEISFSSNTLKFTGKDKKLMANLKAGESKTVYFEVMAPLDQTKGIHTFTISAKGQPDGFQDAVRLTIPVKPNLTYEATATAGHTLANKASEVVYLPKNVSREQGELTVKSSATLAVFLSQALNYLVAYPYGCTEQISSRLKAMALVITGLKIPNLEDKFKLEKVWVDDREYSATDLINIGLAKVYNNQGSDGGFGLWDSDHPDFYVTLEAVDMLKTVKMAGITINETALKKGSEYLVKNFSAESTNMSPEETVAAASVILDLPNAGDTAELITAVKKNVANESLIKDKFNNKSLVQLSILLSKTGIDRNAEKKIQTLLDNRIVVDSRGAFLPMNKANRFHDYFESTIGDTALYLESLTAAKRDVIYSDKIVRWLLNSRDQNGAWGTTQNTLAVVRGFTAYLNWKGETKADFNLATAFNGKQISTKDYNKQTILDQSIEKVKANDFIPGSNNFIEFMKKENQSSVASGFYYDLGLKYYLSGIAGPRDEGFAVSRALYALDDKSGKTALASAKVGDVLRAHIEITVPQDRRFVAIEDYIPAGMEIVDMELATEEKSLRFTEKEVRYRQLHPDYKELRDDRAFIYVSSLKPGSYEFDYYVRALAKGKYLQLPSVASEFYTPENFGRTASSYFEIK